MNPVTAMMRSIQILKIFEIILSPSQFFNSDKLVKVIWPVLETNGSAHLFVALQGLPASKISQGLLRCFDPLKRPRASSSSCRWWRGKRMWRLSTRRQSHARNRYAYGGNMDRCSSESDVSSASPGHSRRMWNCGGSSGKLWQVIITQILLFYGSPLLWHDIFPTPRPLIHQACVASDILSKQWSVMGFTRRGFNARTLLSSYWLLPLMTSLTLVPLSSLWIIGLMFLMLLCINALLMSFHALQCNV